MKIDQQNIAGAGSTQAAALNPASAQRTSTFTATSGDQAELSGVSKAIQSFQSDRAARIDKITALVRGGKYDVSSDLIGRGIVNEALVAGSQPVGAVAR
jgi:anti-sigma28 factor (negative regulator of flagellin synthesis)